MANSVACVKPRRGGAGRGASSWRQSRQHLNAKQRKVRGELVEKRGGGGETLNSPCHSPGKGMAS